jgi:hypothetical protein
LVEEVFVLLLEVGPEFLAAVALDHRWEGGSGESLLLLLDSLDVDCDLDLLAQGQWLLL